MHLEEMEATDRTGREREMIRKFGRQDIDYFPIGKAMSLPDSDQEQQGLMESLMGQVSSLEAMINSIREEMNTNFDKIQGKNSDEKKGANKDDEEQEEGEADGAPVATALPVASSKNKRSSSANKGK